MRCRTVDDIAHEALRIIDEESSVHPEPRAEFFFRGESKNHQSDYDDEPLGTAFQSLLDRRGLVEYERDLYQEAMRLNVSTSSAAAGLKTFITQRLCALRKAATTAAPTA